jgi:hypothetical protein
MILEHAVALIDNFVGTQFLLNVGQIGHVQIRVTATWIVAAIDDAVGHVRVLRVDHGLIWIHVSR